MTKKEMRSHYLTLRKNQPQASRMEADAKICETVLSLPQLAVCKTVMLYISYGAEVDTHALAERLFTEGKQLCAPLCNPSDCSMTPYYFDRASSLCKGAYGILEPEPKQEAALSEIDAVIVPGCVFGRNLHRVGYGKGYYDRFLRQVPHALKIGLCRDCCLAAFVEAEETDTPVDMIVTEYETLRRG